MENISLLKLEVDKYKWDLKLNDEKLSYFNKYYEELRRANERINLTKIIDLEDVIYKHFLDSLSIAGLKKLDLNNKKLLDIGSGAGFPGLPIAICFENADVTMLDSVGKKVNFINSTIDELDLKNAKAIKARVEELDDEKKAYYDIVTSRAVASLNTLLEYSLPFVKIGGYFVAYKSRNVKDELMESKKALSILGGRIVEEFKFNIENVGERNLLLIEKYKDTPIKYPRSKGHPRTRPL